MILTQIQPLPSGLTGAAGIGATYSTVYAFPAGGVVGLSALLRVGLYSGHTMTIRLVAIDSAGNVFPIDFTRLDTGITGTSTTISTAGNYALGLDTGLGAFNSIGVQALVSSAGNAADTLAGEIQFGMGAV